MKTTQSVSAVTYGSHELKEAFRRYWMTGLLVSVTFHLCCVLLLQLIQRPATVDGWRRGNIRTTSIRDIILNPPISEPTPPGGGSQAREADNKSELANPVPVPDDRADPKKTTASQEELREYYDGQMGQEGAPEGAGDVGVVAGRGERVEEPVPQTTFEPLEREPVLVKKVEPVYPGTAIRAGLEGRVWVKILVGTDGRAKDAVVVRSTYEIFNEPALVAARQFVFTPGYMTSGPVEVWVTVPFGFRLRR
jgi:protein TonB